MPSDRHEAWKEELIAEMTGHSVSLGDCAAIPVEAAAKIAIRFAVRQVDAERNRNGERHTHAAKYVDGVLIDECGECGRDIREGVHDAER